MHVQRDRETHNVIARARYAQRDKQGDNCGMRTPCALLIATLSASAGLLVLPAEPPRGFNSWDAYGTHGTYLNASIANSVAHGLADQLAHLGFDILTLDGGWIMDCTFDEHGRVLPSKARWPDGLPPVVQRAHSLGLRVGVWVGRGVHRGALNQSKTVAGTDVPLDEIIDQSPTGGQPNGTCSWDADLLGVNASHPAAPRYYDSVVDLLASWGIDFIKLDCVFGVEAYLPELRLFRAAVARNARPITLSLSPSPAPAGEGALVARERIAAMYRITADFHAHWGGWGGLQEAVFAAGNYSTLIGANHTWPDLDMLPLGARPAGPPSGWHTYLKQADGSYEHRLGWLVGGGDVAPAAPLNFSAASAACSGLKRCLAFTFHNPSGARPAKPVTTYLKDQTTLMPDDPQRPGGIPYSFGGKPEEVLMLTLWGVARSPLMFGGELPIDASPTSGRVLRLLSNRWFNHVHRSSRGNHPFDYQGNCSCTGGGGICSLDFPQAASPCIAMWTAKLAALPPGPRTGSPAATAPAPASPTGATTLVALMNIGDRNGTARVDLAALGIKPKGGSWRYRLWDGWSDSPSRPISQGNTTFDVAMVAHGAVMWLLEEVELARE